MSSSSASTSDQRLLCGGEPIAAVETASTHWQRFRGLMLRKTYTGVLFLPNVKSVHTMFMRFPMEAAFCNDEFVVLDVQLLRPFRFSERVPHARHVFEAPAGRFNEWFVKPGAKLSIESLVDAP